MGTSSRSRSRTNLKLRSLSLLRAYEGYGEHGHTCVAGKTEKLLEQDIRINDKYVKSITTLQDGF